MNLFNKFCSTILSCFGCSAKLDGEDKSDSKDVMAIADLVFKVPSYNPANSKSGDDASNSTAQSPPPPRPRPAPPPPRPRPAPPPLTRENLVDKPANLDLAGGDNVSNSTAQSPQPSRLPQLQSLKSSHLESLSIGFFTPNTKNLQTPPASPTPLTPSLPPLPPPQDPASTSNQSFGGFGLGSLSSFQEKKYPNQSVIGQENQFNLMPPITITEVYTATTNDGVFLLTSQQEIELKIQQRARQIEREQQQINEKCHNLILHFRAEYLIDETRRDYHDRFYRQPNRDSAKDDGIFYIPNGYISVNSDNWRNGGTRDGKPSPTFQSNGGYRSASSDKTLWV
jgi:hypothetical protein